ncbi:MAG TPA: sugar phosphate isomerase/epimerase [Clostridiales bacterium]|nr:sugar phosphate isomerase/epimerase [Clostridiales bacterium]
MKYAVQMYSLRHHIKNGEDLLKILGDVKEIGFEGVEFAGFFDVAPEKLRARLDELGLFCVGAHCGFDWYEEDKIDETLRIAQVLGTPYIGMGGAPTALEHDMAKFEKVMVKAQKRADEAGIKLYFHNHWQEFKPVTLSLNRKPIIERVLEVCYVQVDTYWSHHAGVDTCKFLEDNIDKIVTIHLKDGLKGKPLALGEGDNDIFAIVDCAEKLGIEWGIVENDDPVPDGLSDITRSMKFLRNR